MHKLDFLQQALEDINDITHYISIDLEAPLAARRLKTEILKAATNLTKNPLRYRIYPSHGTLKLEYRKLPVKNYSVFYVVKEDLIEIHRVLYSRRNIGTALADEEE